MVLGACVIGKGRFGSSACGEHFKASSSAPRDYPENCYQGIFQVCRTLEITWCFRLAVLKK